MKKVKCPHFYWYHCHGSGVLSKLEVGEGLSGYTRDRSESGWDDERIDASGSFAYSDLMILPSTHQEVNEMFLQGIKGTIISTSSYRNN